MNDDIICKHGNNQCRQTLCIRCIEERIKESLSLSDDLRGRIGFAISERFNITYEKHGIDYDPDTCWEAADDVIAILVHQLTSQMVTSVPSTVIGSKVFKLDKQKY
jgi:hypothetical protein